MTKSSNKNGKIPTKYLQREVAEALNNAVLAAGHTTALAKLDDGRRAKLGQYSLEIMNILYADVEAGDLTGEELVFVLGGAALLTQCLKVQHSIKLPAIQDLLKRSVIDEED